MSRILLVDDSPHAQRMGERILTDEGYEVVTVSNAESALVRLDDVDPDVILADTVMPGRTGYDICHYVRMSPRHRHVKIILTAGVLEPFDEVRLRESAPDGSIKKPFEASALIAAVKPLAEAAASARVQTQEAVTPQAKAQAQLSTPFIAVVDPEQVRAAVTVALDASMAAMVDEIARQVMAAFGTRKHEPPSSASAQEMEPLEIEPLDHAEPTPSGPRVQTVRKVSHARGRPGSFLGLDLHNYDPE